MNEWKERYNKLTVSEQLLDLKKPSPENFIDNLKMEYLKQYLPDEGIILEVGAGSGRLITRIGTEYKNLKLIGLDYERFPTILIKNNFEKFNLNGSVICGDAFKIPLKDNSIHAVISGGLLEHFNATDINYIIKEMHRVLKTDGLLYADIVPGKSSLCRPIILTKHYGGYENKFSKNQWENILKTGGFHNSKVFRACILPPNFYGWFRSNPQLKLMYRLQPYINKLDKTIFADMLGFMYYVFARK